MTVALFEVDIPEGVTSIADIEEIIGDEVAAGRFKALGGLHILAASDGSGEDPFWLNLFSSREKIIEWLREYIIDRLGEELRDAQTDQDIGWVNDVEESIRNTREATEDSLIDTLVDWDIYPCIVEVDQIR